VAAFGLLVIALAAVLSARPSIANFEPDD